MASFQSFGGLRTIRSNDRVMGSKPRGKMVKPILKRLSHSEKNSLDLDRGWDEQEEQFQYRSSPTWNSTWAPTKAAPTSGTSAGMGIGMMGSSCYTGAGSTVAIEVDEGRNSISGLRYHHTRTVSGTSHISVSSSGSGSGTGSGTPAPTSMPRSSGPAAGPGPFAHPFQQTPRTATPSLSYQNSLASSSLLDGSRDYSPTIAEDEDCNYNYNGAAAEQPRDADPAASGTSLGPSNHPSSSSTHRSSTSPPRSHPHQHQHAPVSPNACSQPILASPNPNRPSLSSTRTSSYSDHSPRAPALRINTVARTASTATVPSRLAHVASRSELPMSSPSADVPTSPAASQHNVLGSPASPRAAPPMSPMSRSSFEAVNFRLRSKSELDTATRADHLREARRKFEARERLKEEKYAREEIKRRERAENKRAQALEKEAIACRKERDLARQRAEAIALAEAMPLNSKHSRKISSNTSGRPSLQRSPSSHMDMGRASLDPEKFASSSYDPEKFASGNYESMETSTPPAFGQQAGGGRGGSKGTSFDAPRRAHTAAKRRTHGAWQAFILWLRTRLLKLSRDH